LTDMLPPIERATDRFPGPRLEVKVQRRFRAAT
jgi:hypothetical protein